MLLETDEFRAGQLPARLQAYHDFREQERQERITVKGQIRIEPRRTTKQAEAAALDVPKRPAKIIRGAKREHVVKRIAATLDTGRMSKFEYEGTCRHGIRAELCLDGEAWSAADREAAAIVSEALASLHARRPSYDEGQREYTTSPDCCSWCQSPLDEDVPARRKVSYCDEDCARAAMRAREINQHRHETRAFHAAWDVISRSRHPARECEHCGKTFRPARDERYCSSSCSKTHAIEQAGRTWMGHALLQPRTCPTCKDVFQPRRSNQVHCSPKCGFEARRTVPERKCEHCGTAFQPESNRNTNRFCSKACHYAHGHEEHRCECSWCGTAFIAKAAHALLCSEACRLAERKYRLGVVPTYLATHVFDHFISVPALQAAAQLQEQHP